MIVHHYNHSNYRDVYSSCGLVIPRDEKQTYNSNYTYNKTNRNKITTSIEKINCIECLKVHLIKELFKIDKIEQRIKELSGQ